jgi:hypothetical protein
LAQKLKDSPKIWKLAKDLGIKPIVNPVDDILNYCEKKIKKLLGDFSECSTLFDLLDWLAGNLGTSFEEIHNENDLIRIKEKYLNAGEKIFVTLEEEFSSAVCGITFKKANRDTWERPYVSVIDCRGTNGNKAYYTKWHELAHLLIITDQMRLAFKRTLHLPVKDPEEILVDRIAGKFGFYAPLIKPHVSREISFEEIESLKQNLCPEASFQSSLIGFVNAWPHPCILILCRPALKKSEQGQSMQQRFGFKELADPPLRAVKVTTNSSARSANLFIHENMRVPGHSVIYSIHKGETDYKEAEENLSWWQTSDGLILPGRTVVVKAKRVWEDVYALIIPQ